MAKTKGTNSTTIRLRLPYSLLRLVDEWAALQNPPLSRSKAIQVLVGRGLALWEAQQAREAQERLAA